MNRRGFFGALAGGLAAAAGLRSLVGLPGKRAGRWATTRIGAAKFYDVGGAEFQAGDIVVLKTSAMGRSQLMPGGIERAIALPGTAPWRAPNDSPAAVVATPPEDDAALPVPAWATGRDLPEVWPGRSAAITATVALPPLAQVERLVDLFAASGEEAPAFAGALIGELVLTRMRLAASDPRTLWGLAS